MSPLEKLISHSDSQEIRLLQNPKIQYRFL